MRRNPDYHGDLSELFTPTNDLPYFKDDLGKDDGPGPRDDPPPKDDPPPREDPGYGGYDEAPAPDDQGDKANDREDQEDEGAQAQDTPAAEKPKGGDGYFAKFSRHFFSIFKLWKRAEKIVTWDGRLLIQPPRFCC